MPVTIADVAREAGVSTATVSRALRGLPDVAPATRDRVMTVAQRLNYSIDTHASRLASGRRMTIGLVMPLLEQWFFNKVMTAAESILVPEGYDVIRYTVTSLGNLHEVLRNLAQTRRVDGIIVVSLNLREQDIALLAASGVPVVTIENRTPHFPWVCVDNEAAAFAATAHLLELGHRQLGIITGHRQDPLDFNVPYERIAGVERALAAFGIPLACVPVAPGRFSAAGGAAAMEALLLEQPRPTGVIALSDEMAIGAIKMARARGLTVPRDLSVIGIDDHDLSFFVDLTTVQQPVAEFGTVAAERMLDMLAGGSADRHATTMLPTQLIVRETTAPPPD